jgi:hypothetical protein
MANNNNALKQRAFDMLETGIDRKHVKRYLTSQRVKGRQAVAMLCQQEMALLNTRHLR